MDPAPVTFRPNVAVDALPDYVGKPHTGPTLVTTLDGVLVGILAPSP